MGFWRKSKVENKGNSGPDRPWISLHSDGQLDEIVAKSHDRLQLIFKHSTRCGISRRVKDQFISGYNLNEDQADLYYLDLLGNRDISNLISERFNVWHESPQLIVIKNGMVRAHASHGSILDLKY